MMSWVTLGMTEVAQFDTAIQKRAFIGEPQFPPQFSFGAAFPLHWKCPGALVLSQTTQPCNLETCRPRLLQQQQSVHSIII
jgi:hypothetical protein